MIYEDGSAVYHSYLDIFFLSCFAKPIFRATVSVETEEHFIVTIILSKNFPWIILHVI